MQVKQHLSHFGLDVTLEEVKLEDLLRQEEQVVGVKHVWELRDLAQVPELVRTELSVVVFAHLLDGQIGTLQEVLHEEADEFTLGLSS